MTTPDNIQQGSRPEKGVLSVIVLGASGDLAKKKTYPALFALYSNGLLPKNVIIYGYARSKSTDEEFRKNMEPKLKAKGDKQEFLAKCFYFSGNYDSHEDFAKLAQILDEKEKKVSLQADRLFYFAIPPSVFIPAAEALRNAVMSTTGFNRVIIEKPFGKDLDSSRELVAHIGKLFTEDQIYRIDHYLGKEMVQNLMVMRFANSVFEPVWNRFHIKSVTITFKEDIGTEGRGGYFDEFGIIRDVIQNHLIQMLSIVAMEPPVTIDAEDVRNEKVKLLRAISPLQEEDLVIGQYVRAPGGKDEGYLEDKTVPKGSVTPTFATAILHIHNQRWEGVPFILKAGKSLNERKSEVRIQFQPPPHNLFDAQPNELVIRVQPNEAVYMKFTSKQPGLTADLKQSELDLTYKDRFGNVTTYDAYERLLIDAIKGDHNLFVRADELDASWRIFTPVLHKLDKDKKKPEEYAFGSRGPASSDKLIQNYGFERTKGYEWHPSPAMSSK